MLHVHKEMRRVNIIECKLFKCHPPVSYTITRYTYMMLDFHISHPALMSSLCQWPIVSH